MKLSRHTCLALAAAALSLQGCAPDSPTENASAPAESSAGAVAAAPDLATTLTAYRWKLVSAVDPAGRTIAALFPGPENQLGLEFSDGQLGVTGGCNRIGAGFQVVEVSRLQLGPARSTMMGCPPPLAEADAAIAKALSGTLQAELQGESGAPVLQLATADVTVLAFKGSPTPETRFGRPGTRAFLEVSAEPCHLQSEASPGCLRVRELHFDEQGLPSGDPGEWHGLPAGIEGYTPTPGQELVVRVKRFEARDSTGSEPTAHFVFDMVVESRTVQ